jgi:hypothetical protein
VGPGQDLLQGAALIAHPRGLEDPGQPFDPQRADLGGGGHGPRDRQRRRVVEDVGEAAGIARQDNIKERMNLIAR